MESDLHGIGPPTGTTSLCFDLNGGTYDVRIIRIQPGSVGDINSDGKVDIKNTGFIAGHFSEINPHLPFFVLLNALPLDEEWPSEPPEKTGGGSYHSARTRF